MANSGWAELRNGDWVAARALFESALAERETADALEGLSWAAWWLDDAETVFASRERAFRLYKESGDARSAARMCTWLASDELDFHGAGAVASGWLQRAHRFLDPLEPGPDHGWLAFHDGYLAHGRGETDEACRQAARAAEIGRNHGVPDLEMLGLALEGAALVASARVVEGMRCLDEATTVALEGDATIPISSAWACCFMVSACEAVRDYDRASQWCDRIAEFADRYGSRYMLAFCRAEYGAVYLSRGRWGEAEAMLEAAHEDFSRSRPPWAGGPLVALAELRRRQGKANEAARLLDEAGDGSGAQLCRARLALDEGDTARAIELLERQLRHQEQSLGRVPALELLVRARVANGDLDNANAVLAELREIEVLVGTAPLQASADRSEALLLTAEGDHDRARPLLEDALAHYERDRLPFEAAETRLELAATLLALGRADDAERESKVAQQLLAACRGDDSAPLPELTARERDVIRLLAEGLTNRQIAKTLVVSEHTVHRHVTNILRKLDLPSRTAAATHAVRAGLVE